MRGRPDAGAAAASWALPRASPLALTSRRQGWQVPLLKAGHSPPALARSRPTTPLSAAARVPRASCENSVKPLYQRCAQPSVAARDSHSCRRTTHILPGREKRAWQWATGCASSQQQAPHSAAGCRLGSDKEHAAQLTLGKHAPFRIDACSLALALQLSVIQVGGLLRHGSPACIGTAHMLKP